MEGFSFDFISIPAGWVNLGVMGFYLILQEDTLWDNVINGLRKELLDSGQRHCQVGSLAGAAHLLKNNTGVLR